MENIAAVLLVMVVTSLPISLSRVLQTGLHPNHIIHILMSILIIFIFTLRKKLDLRWFLIVYLFIFTTLSISAFIQYGLVSAGFYFAAGAIYILSMGFGLLAGVICTGFFAVIIACIAYLWVSGFLIFPGDAGRYILLPTVWATMTSAFLVTTALVFVSSTRIVHELNELVDTIDEQRRLIDERNTEVTRINEELEQALKEVKTISGLLPICSNCKKIRDDQGYWQQVERYVEVHSDVTFTHGLCPDCIESLYPEIADRILKKKRGSSTKE